MYLLQCVYIVLLRMTSQMNNEDLVRRAQTGDQHTFGILFLLYKDEIYACLMQVVCNDEVAKDLWHDTYLKAWGHIQSLNEPARFRAWLHTVARNLAFDWLRKARRERLGTPEENEKTYDLIDDSANPEVVIERDYVRSVLAEMESALREVLLLSIHGYSRAEIAQRLGYKESTVITYLPKARKQFRQLYHTMGHTDNASSKTPKPESPDENDHAQKSHDPDETRKE